MNGRDNDNDTRRRSGFLRLSLVEARMVVESVPHDMSVYKGAATESTVGSAPPKRTDTVDDDDGTMRTASCRHPSPEPAAVAAKFHPLPNTAVLEPHRKAFRLIKSSGGTIAKGAFGHYIANAVATTESTTTTSLTEDGKHDDDEDDDNLVDETKQEGGGEDKEATRQKENETTDKTDNNKAIKKSSGGHWYLFIEEVIYLFERGLLEVRDERDNVMNSYDLYRLLPHHGMPLAILLVYLHLRQQTYRVVRHSEARRAVIQQQIKEPAGKQRLAAFGPQLRHVAATAQPPPEEDLARHLAWDVYPPQATYQKRDPGLPAFSVLVTSHSVPFSVDRIRNLVLDHDRVPIKVASVADTGTVILLSVTNIGAPAIGNNGELKSWPVKPKKARKTEEDVIVKDGDAPGG